MSQIDDFLSGKTPESSPQSIDDFLGAKPNKKKEAGGSFSDYAGAVNSALGQGVANLAGAAGTFIQAPAANTLSGILGAKALADRGLTWLINQAEPGSAVPHTETQEDAQRASQFAAESRAENANTPWNLPARAGRYLEQDSRRVVQENQANDRATNPELMRQQQAMGDAEGFTGNIKAAFQNPLALTHTLVRSAPDMATGVGVASVVARARMAGAAMAGEAAAANAAKAGANEATQAAAAKAAIEAVESKAVASASTVGTLSEAGSSAMQAREGTYQEVAGKIRLQRGDSSFGLEHVETRHGDEIRAAGFASVEEFVSGALTDIESVWKPAATSQLVVIQATDHGKVVFIQLQAAKDESGDFYTVKTAFPSSRSYVKKRKQWKKLWGRLPVPAADVGASALSANLGNEADSKTAMVSSQSSAKSVQPLSDDGKRESADTSVAGGNPTSPGGQIGHEQKNEGWKPLWSRDPVPADASGASGFVGQSPEAGETTPTVSDQSGTRSAAQSEGGDKEAKPGMPGDSVLSRGESAGAGMKLSRSVMKSVAANIDRGLTNLAKAVTGKSTVHRAMFRNGLGWVDFVWGDVGRVKPSGKTAGGKGLSHIVEARMRKDGFDERQAIGVLSELVRTIAAGQEFDRKEVGGSVRVGVRNDGYVVWMTKSKGSNAWIVTGYEENPDGAVAGRATTAPTQSAASLTRDGQGAGSNVIVQKEIAPAIGSSEGVQFPKHGDITTGRKKILTEKNLAKQEGKGAKVLWGGSEPRPVAAGQQPLYAGSPETSTGQDAPIAQGQSVDSVSAQALSAESGAQSGGLSFEALDALVNRIKAANPNMPTVHVLADPSKAPLALREYIIRQDAWDDVEGAMHKGELYMFASGLSDELRAEHVLAEHEAAHYGLRAVLGSSLKTAMHLVYAQNANVRRAVTELQKRGKLSTAEATEEVIVDIPTAELAKIKGWRKVVVMVRDWMQAHGYEKIAQKITDMLDGSLSQQQRADLFVAELVHGARDYVAGKSPSRRVGYIGDTRLSTTLQEDIKRQEAWLQREARARGFADIEDMLAKDYPVFEKLAELWRKKNPASEGVMLSRAQDNAYAKAVRVWQATLASNPKPGTSIDMPMPTVLRAMGVKSSVLTLPVRYLQGIVEKHTDLPAILLQDLPQLLSDPVVMIPYAGGGYRVLVDAQTSKGNPIIVGIGEDGRIQTVTPMHGERGVSGRDYFANLLEQALATNGAKVYARNKEALAKTRALGGIADGYADMQPLDVPSSLAGPATIALPRNSRDKAIVMYRGIAVKRKGDFGPGIRLSRATPSPGAADRAQDITDTSAFKRWFGDSKVVDAEGKPLVVYHGTNGERTVFEPYWKQLERDASASELKSGSIADIYRQAKAEPDIHFFAEDIGHAETYGGDVVEAYLKIERMVGSPDANREDAIAEMLAANADGAQFYDTDANGGYGGVAYVVRSSNQIKSATGNNGNFDATNPDIRLSIRQQEGLSAQDRADKIIHEKAKEGGSVLDAAAHALTRMTRLEKLTSWAYDFAAQQLDRFTPDVIKAGVVSDYGVPESVIDQRAIMQGRKMQHLRKVGGLLDKLNTLTRSESRVAYAWMNEADASAADRLMQDLPSESVKVLQEVQKMIDHLSREAVTLGQLSEQAYKAHRFAYLRRSYAKHVVELSPKENAKRGRTISVLGDQYKGRGFEEGASMRQIQTAAPGWWKRKTQEGQADTALKGEKFIRLERRAPSGEGVTPLEGMDGKQPGKVLEVNYWPASEPMPAKYQDWTEAGTFEARDTKGDKVVMWRDYTQAERTKMGEVDEARFAIAKTLHGMIHDVEVGRYLAWLAKTQSKLVADDVPGKLAVAEEGWTHVFKPGEWVQVPDTKITGTSVAKYGKLAGRFIPGPVWNDVRQVGNSSFGKVPFEAFNTLQSWWKTSKTALSPGVHMNNIMSNFVMADWHDVSQAHVRKALRILMAASNRDKKGILGVAMNAASKMGIADREAAQLIVNRYKDSGGELGSWATVEMQNDQLEPILKDLQKELGIEDELGNQVGAFNAVQQFMHAKFPAVYNAAGGLMGSSLGPAGSKAAGKVAGGVVQEGKTLIDLYQSEDEVFRLAAWLKSKEAGMDDMAAGKVSRKSFLDYSVNAPWIVAMKNSAWPFMAFSYRAIPLFLETAGKKPHKLLKLMAVAGVLNAMGAMLAGGDDDEERKLLPEEKAGRIWGMVPKLIRMPWNDAHGSPVFLDVRRFVPVGDVFDMDQGHSAIPLLPALQPGGIIGMLGELTLNKSAFTGKAITQETDTVAEQSGKVLEYLYKWMAPNVLGLPGSYATTGVSNAISGKEDGFGREQSVAQAIASAYGLKVGSYSPEVLRRNLLKKTAAETREIDHNISQLGRQYQTKGISQEKFVEDVAIQQDKKAKLLKKMADKMR